jgi:hypothetical protein
MPHMCFSYPPDVPQPGPGDLRRMPFACFSYPAEVPRRMPAGSCFGYPVDAPLGVSNRRAAPTALPGLRRMPTSSCFRY